MCGSCVFTKEYDSLYSKNSLFTFILDLNGR